MCGICGVYNYSNGKAADRKLIENMCAVMKHRGPDDQGILLDRNLGLGTRRLSIIDLNNGTQPIANEDGTVYVVLNGEIYNFPELRQQLLAKGHKFRTRTDTEVIVHLYEDKGIDCLNDLNGMFALAIWDKTNRDLYVARDRLGIKPLHYSLKNGSLRFGSEIKAVIQDRQIERKIDQNALAEYLTLLYIPAPSTIYEDVKKLNPGHYLHAKEGSVDICRYWMFELNPRNGKTDDEFCEILRHKFDSAVARQMISDVPLGAFLSGGVDSSLVVSSMAKTADKSIKTFTIGFDHNGLDERPYAQRVASWLGCDHHDQQVNSDVIHDLQKVVWYYDEPFADEAVLPTYFVSRAARKKVKVVLTGEGADELFAGYRVYQTERLNRWYTLLPKHLRRVILTSLRRVANLNWKPEIHDWLSWLERGLCLTDIAAEKRYFSKLAVFSPSFQKELLKNGNNDEKSSWQLYEAFNRSHQSDFLERLLSVGMSFNLPNKMLTKVDRASMAASLEVRVPFLDNEIVDFAARLPLALKLRGLCTKHIVKKVLTTRLPNKVHRRSKHGFDVPFKQWFRSDLNNVAQRILRKEVLDKQGIFNSAVVEKLLRDHQLGISNNTQHIYGLTVFQIWYNTIITGDAGIEKRNESNGFSVVHADAG